MTYKFWHSANVNVSYILYVPVTGQESVVHEHEVLSTYCISNLFFVYEYIFKRIVAVNVTVIVLSFNVFNCYLRNNMEAIWGACSAYLVHLISSVVSFFMLCLLNCYFVGIFDLPKCLFCRLLRLNLHLVSFVSVHTKCHMCNKLPSRFNYRSCLGIWINKQ